MTGRTFYFSHQHVLLWPTGLSPSSSNTKQSCCLAALEREGLMPEAEQKLWIQLSAKGQMLAGLPKLSVVL